MTCNPHRPPVKLHSFRQILNHASTALGSFCLRLGFVSCCVAGAAAAGTHRLNSDELKMFALVANHSDQQRPHISLDPILCKVARERATDMGKKNYFDHVNRSGHGPNFLVRRAGFDLPYYYDSSRPGNSIESIAKTYGTPRETFALWMNSGPHQVHILGNVTFYSEQTSVGVGVYRSKMAPFAVYSVFISAPANAAKNPPALTLMNSKGKIVAQTRLSTTAWLAPVLGAIRK